MIYSLKGSANAVLDYIYPQALEESAVYRKTEDGEEYSGETLMNLGIPFTANKDYKNEVLVFQKIS